MYTIIGKRPGMSPASSTRADSVMGHCINESWIGAFCSTAPDGLILEGPGPQYYETIGGVKRPIDHNNLGKKTTKKCDPPFLFTEEDALELARDFRQEVRSFLTVRAKIKGRV